MAKKTCDGRTEYSCEIDHVEEKGEVRQWQGLDRDDTLNNVRTRPPDFVFPFHRVTPKWTKDCTCPEGCVRFLRGGDTLHGSRQAKLRRRLASDGTVFEATTTVTTYRRIRAKFVCAKLEKEVSALREYDVEDDAAFAVLEADLKELEQIFGEPLDPESLI